MVACTQYLFGFNFLDRYLLDSFFKCGKSNILLIRISKTIIALALSYLNSIRLCDLNNLICHSCNWSYVSFFQKSRISALLQLHCCRLPNSLELFFNVHYIMKRFLQRKVQLFYHWRVFTWRTSVIVFVN